MCGPTIPRLSACAMVLNPKKSPHLPGFTVLMVQRPVKQKAWKGERMAEGHVFPGGIFQHEDDPTMQHCAVRELFEETGMLLAQPEQEVDRGIFSGHFTLSVEEIRSLRPLGFQGALSKLGLRPSIRNLKPWAQWISPKFLKRRYDTKFYVTAVESKKSTLPDNSETIKIDWFDPEQALELARARVLNLAPPQFYILHQLTQFCTVEDVLNYTEGLSITAMQPDARKHPVDGWTLLLPGDTCYQITGEDLARKGPRHRLILDERSRAEKLDTATWIIHKSDCGE